MSVLGARPWTAHEDMFLRQLVLALTYWAFKQVEGGRSSSDVIKDIVEGNKCLAVLGIALDLALESWATTDTTLALAKKAKLSSG